MVLKSFSLPAELVDRLAKKQKDIAQYNKIESKMNKEFMSKDFNQAEYDKLFIKSSKLKKKVLGRDIEDEILRLILEQNQ